MLNWEDLHHFAALAQEGSLSAAARVLKVDHATVARRVAALESSLELKLVDRRTRSYVLTADGRRISALASQMLEQAFTVDRAARAARPALAGTVTVSAPPTLASTLIAPRLGTLRSEYPDIHIRLIGEKRNASLSRREADIAIRLSRPTERRLVARRIGSMVFALYASAEYLSKHSAKDFDFIAYDEPSEDLPQQRWLKMLAGARPVVLRTSELEAQQAAARAGVGVVALPRFLGDRDGQLVRTNIASTSIAREIWLVVHRDMQRAASVRAVMRFLTDCFA
jgi:DNA-binding transcriptional LysR family regulator